MTKLERLQEKKSLLAKFAAKLSAVILSCASFINTGFINNTTVLQNETGK